MLKNKYGRNLLFAILTLTLSVGWLSVGNVQADSIQTVAESYTTSRPLQQGMIVQLDDKDKTKVAPASYNSPKKMFGVTVSASATPVSLTSSSKEQQAYVVTSGRYRVLVSNQKGAIAAGDFISISAIDGIGMKADDSQNTVLGRAVDAFDGRTAVISTTSLNLEGGKKVDAAIGSIIVNIAIRSNPTYNGSGGVPGFVENFATSIAGKSVNPAQVYGSILVLLIGLGVVSVLIYSGIQTSMTAIGRNPLAKQSVIRNMFQVVIVAGLIFIGCLIAVYLILKL
jgi:quercetin dioxygenase-like cupin family protein